MKWFIPVSICYMLVACRTSKVENAAIIKVLETESATWRSRDSAGHANCWFIQPYSSVLVSTTDGKTLDIPATAMITASPERMGNGGSAVNSQYKISVQGKSAWVSHHEESTDMEGKKSYSYEIRMLEKISGQWKLVGQSIHMLK